MRALFSHRTCWGRSKHAALTLSVVLVGSAAAYGQVKGDIELLRLIANAHRDNLQRVTTWKGAAVIEEAFDEPQMSVVSQRSQATFVYDASEGGTRWQWIVADAKKREGDRLAVAEEQIETIDEMIRTDGFFRHSRGYQDTATSEWERTLRISPPEVFTDPPGKSTEN